MATPVELIITAKNLASKGFASASESVSDFGKKAAKVFAAIAAATAAAGVAVVGFGVKMLQAYAVQEKAERDLIAARRAGGDATAENIDELKRLAAEMQNETAVADEVTLARMARLRLLGIESDALGDAAKATIALTNAGMGEETAMRAIVAARSGDFSMLTRYIPALRTAKDETEKAAIVNKFLAQSYDASKESIKTVSGRWAELKGRIGDFKETIGEAIAKSGGAQEMLAKISEKVAALTARIQQWIAGGGLDRMIDGFKKWSTLAVAGVKTVWDSFSVTFSNLTKIARNVADVLERSFTRSTDKIGWHLAKMWAKVRGEAFNIEPPKDVFDGLLDQLEKLEDPFARTQEIWDQAFADLEKTSSNASDAMAGNITNATDAMAESFAGFAGKASAELDKVADKADEVASKTAEQIQGLEDDITKLMEDEHEAQQELEDLDEAEVEQKKQDELNRLQEIAAGGVEGFIQQQQQQQAAEDQAAADAERLGRLRGKLERGTVLSKKDQEWLDAFEAVEKAQAEADKIRKEMEEEAKKQRQKLVDEAEATRKAIEKIRDEQAKLLALGGA